MKNKETQQMLTFGEHLEVLRKLLFRVIGVAVCFAIAIFIFKDLTFTMLLSPSEYDFITYRWIERVVRQFVPTFALSEFHVNLIATDLSSQFMTHITTSIYLGLLAASPYILFELFRFVSPALYENEKRYSVPIVILIYLLFIVGVLMSYFILFPISFRFLGTYSVAERVVSNITLDSYISTFVTLTLMMGLVFQLPIISYILGKMGIITYSLLAKYRKYAFIIILVVSAIITPPDLMTLIVVALPLYMLYEVSIVILKLIKHKKGDA